MATNSYIAVGYRINSCLVSSNSYRVLSPESAFEQSHLEEITDEVRQGDGRCFMSAQPNRSRETLWMIPFTMNQPRLFRFLDAMECTLIGNVRDKGLVFPLDVVSESINHAYLMRPIDRINTLPIRTFMPNVAAARWKLSQSLFRRVEQLHHMGLTSNGISREQMRVDVNQNEVILWLNETMSLSTGSGDTATITRHQGFLSIPAATEKACEEASITIRGEQRDIYSAAICAFYMIMHSHPFVGSAFYRLVHNDYLTTYQNWPRYILESGTENNLGNQMLSRAVGAQWDRTVPELKELFNGIFLAVTHPSEQWDDNGTYWDINAWYRALELDAKKNDNDGSRGEYHFENEMYHLV